MRGAARPPCTSADCRHGSCPRLPSHAAFTQGTWEAPECEVRGQFTGHYLTALSLLYQATGECAIVL
jgi:hypothetical protein